MKDQNTIEFSEFQKEAHKETLKGYLTSNEALDSDYIDVDFDDSYGDLKIKKNDLEKLSRSAIALIKHRGKLQLFNRKSVTTPINDINESEISYKNVALLKKFLTLGNNIISSRITSALYNRQRILKTSIKRARELALLPYPGQKQKNDSGFNS
jgi:small subunit ribosomal protein S18